MSNYIDRCRFLYGVSGAIGDTRAPMHEGGKKGGGGSSVVCTLKKNMVEAGVGRDEGEGDLVQ